MNNNNNNNKKNKHHDTVHSLLTDGHFFSLLEKNNRSLHRFGIKIPAVIKVYLTTTTTTTTKENKKDSSDQHIPSDKEKQGKKQWMMKQ